MELRILNLQALEWPQDLLMHVTTQFSTHFGIFFVSTSLDPHGGPSYNASSNHVRKRPSSALRDQAKDMTAGVQHLELHMTRFALTNLHPSDIFNGRQRAISASTSPRL